MKLTPVWPRLLEQKKADLTTLSLSLALSSTVEPRPVPLCCQAQRCAPQRRRLRQLQPCARRPVPAQVPRHHRRHLRHPSVCAGDGRTPCLCVRARACVRTSVPCDITLYVRTPCTQDTPFYVYHAGTLAQGSLTPQLIRRCPHPTSELHTRTHAPTQHTYIHTRPTHTARTRTHTTHRSYPIQPTPRPALVRSSHAPQTSDASTLMTRSSWFWRELRQFAHAPTSTQAQTHPPTHTSTELAHIMRTHAHLTPARPHTQPHT